MRKRYLQLTVTQTVVIVGVFFWLAPQCNPANGQPPAGGDLISCVCESAEATARRAGSDDPNTADANQADTAKPAVLPAPTSVRTGQASQPTENLQILDDDSQQFKVLSPHKLHVNLNQSKVITVNFPIAAAQSSNEAVCTVQALNHNSDPTWDVLLTGKTHGVSHVTIWPASPIWNPLILRVEVVMPEQTTDKPDSPAAPSPK